MAAKRRKCTRYAYAMCTCAKAAKGKAKRSRAGARVVCPPLDVLGQFYDVVSKRQIEGNLEGQCVYDDNLIELLEEAEGRMIDTLLHEIKHAVLDAGGGKYLIRRKHKLSVAKYSELEEDFIRALTPGFRSVLMLAGWLRIPRISEPESLPVKTRHRKPR